VAELERKQLDCELRHTALEVTTLSPTALYDALQAHSLVH
jgi:hypothetical protein